MIPESYSPDSASPVVDPAEGEIKDMDRSELKSPQSWAAIADVEPESKNSLPLSRLHDIETILIEARSVLRAKSESLSAVVADSFGWSVRDNMGIRGLRRAGYEVVFLTSRADAEARAHAEELGCETLVIQGEVSDEARRAELSQEIRLWLDRRETNLREVMFVTDRAAVPFPQAGSSAVVDHRIEGTWGAIVSTASFDLKHQLHGNGATVEGPTNDVRLCLQSKAGQGALLEVCHLLIPIRLKRSRNMPTTKSLISWILGSILASVITASPAFAESTERIRFPEEELATESVLPVFDQPASVKARNVELASRLELGLQGGYAMTEPFFNPMSFGLSVAYHFNEEWAAQVMYNSQMQGLSNEANQLNPIPNTNPPVNANLQYAPAPKAIAIGNVQYAAYYGKISLSKETVMNLHLYGLAGAGMITLGDEQKPLITVGLGQKFYFTNSMSFRFDLRVLAYQGPDATSIRLDNKTGPQPSSAFSNRTFIEGFLAAGISYALPAF